MKPMKIETKTKTNLYEKEFQKSLSSNYMENPDRYSKMNSFGNNFFKDNKCEHLFESTKKTNKKNNNEELHKKNTKHLNKEDLIKENERLKSEINSYKVKLEYLKEVYEELLYLQTGKNKGSKTNNNNNANITINNLSITIDE